MKATAKTIACSAPHAALLVVTNNRAKAKLTLSLTRRVERRNSVVASGALDATGRDLLLTALLDWHYVEDELPDDEVRVLIAVTDSGEPDFGCLLAGRWQFENQAWSDCGVSVYAWAHAPGVPAKKAQVAA